MRQRRDDFDAVAREEVRQVGLARDGQHREVAPVHHVTAEPPRALDQPTEVRIQLRRAAGDVDRRDLASRERVETQRHRLARHHLAPIRSRIDVAVPARLVA